MSAPGPDTAGRIRTLIVDDEPIARRRIRRLLAEEADIEVVGECGSGAEAAGFLNANTVDLLFLDVQMPEMDGFALLDSLPEDRIPVVVFVTAYDEYALKAFEAHAFDYLLKPFDQARFSSTLRRARTQVGYARQQLNPANLAAMLEELGARRSQQTRFAVKANGRVIFLRTRDIDWVEAADNYVCLHAGAETHVLRETMNSIEARLDPSRFVRIHRSTIVNVDRIKELRPWFHGEHIVAMHGGKELTLSRSYREKLLSVMTR